MTQRDRRIKLCVSVMQWQKKKNETHRGITLHHFHEQFREQIDEIQMNLTSFLLFFSSFVQFTAMPMFQICT